MRGTYRHIRLCSDLGLAELGEGVDGFGDNPRGGVLEGEHGIRDFALLQRREDLAGGFQGDVGDAVAEAVEGRLVGEGTLGAEEANLQFLLQR